jgi:small-conductance mechanosensitive channel
LPPNVEALLKLLADPSVQAWIEAQKGRTAAAPGTAPAGATAEMAMGGRLAEVRRHLIRVAGAIQRVPAEVLRARTDMMESVKGAGVPGLFPLLFGFVVLGLGLQGLYRLVTRRFAVGVGKLPVVTARERGMAILACLAQDLGRVAAFVVGSVGAFLVLEWPTLLRDVVLAYLVAIALIWLARAGLLAMLSPIFRRCHPDAAALRIVPLDDRRAAFWTRWLTAAISVFAIGFATIVAMKRHGFPIESQYLIAYTFGLALLAVGIVAVWRAPSTLRPDARIRPVVGKWLLTSYFVALWSLWAAHAMPLFWLAVVAVVLPAAIRFAQPCIVNILRPRAYGEAGDQPPSIAVACVERGVRAVFIVIAVLLLARAWDIHLVAMTQTDTLSTRALRGLMSAVIILLVADFLWHVARTAIDLKIAEVGDLGEHASDENRRRARLRTLLPILRTAVMIVLGTMAVLTALAALGVEIGPLIAGAGVVGVAVGFGSQALVRDVISGVFYLLDDAFRIGDYIISGNYKGHVESFTLRSVKLRHHRGSVFTVPFGVLGAVQNMSRDWVIEKITIGITYDSDVEKARKIIKKIGLELAEDPEFKGKILEPLKMQGVEKFGDFAIELRLKMMTKPHEQYVPKRRALAMIKKRFEEGGIKFASPVVQIAGGSSATEAAAATVALERAQQAGAG